MGRVVSPLKAFCREVGVHLGCGQMDMAEQFLNRSKIRPRIQQVRCVAVAQSVNRRGLLEAGEGAFGGVFHPSPIPIFACSDIGGAVATDPISKARLRA